MFSPITFQFRDAVSFRGKGPERTALASEFNITRDGTAYVFERNGHAVLVPESNICYIQGVFVQTGTQKKK